MTAYDILTTEIERFDVKDIIKKYRLTPVFETWVNAKVKYDYIFSYTPIADGGIRLYIEGSDVCVGILHSMTNTLRTTEYITDTFGRKVLGKFPWQTKTCETKEEFDKNIGKLIEEHRQKLIDEGSFKLFKVELTEGGYDSYDSAIIACVDKATLEELCKGKFNRYRWHDDPDVIFEQSFNIQEGQKVDSIVEVGVYTGEMYRDTKAKVICSSFNAG
jgi:hypothetical protein